MDGTAIFVKDLLLTNTVSQKDEKTVYRRALSYRDTARQDLNYRNTAIP